MIEDHNGSCHLSELRNKTPRPFSDKVGDTDKMPVRFWFACLASEVSIHAAFLLSSEMYVRTTVTHVCTYDQERPIDSGFEMPWSITEAKSSHETYR